MVEESPSYQEIVQEGRRLAREEGLQRQRSLILKQLTRQVGELSPEVAAQVQALSLDDIEALGEALLDFSEFNDLVNWLAARS